MRPDQDIAATLRLTDEQIAELQADSEAEIEYEGQTPGASSEVIKMARYTLLALDELAELRADQAARSRFKQGRVLTPDEQARCLAEGITIGYDVDDESLCPIQHAHLCVEVDPEMPTSPPVLLGVVFEVET